MASYQQLDSLEPFLAADETTLDGYSTATEIGVLTDRQLLSLEQRGSEANTMVVDSVYLDQLGGATITHETAPDVHEDELGYGIGSLCLAFLSLLLAVVIDESGLSALLVLVGIGVGLMGVVLLLEAYDTPADSVSITLQTIEGDVAWQTRLDEEYLEFAQAVSRAVSDAHESGGEVTQTIG